MKRTAFLILVALLLLLCACGEATVDVREVSTPAPTATPAPTPQPTPQSTPELTPQSTPEPTPQLVALEPEQTETPEEPSRAAPEPTPTPQPEKDWVLNTNTLKFHEPSCSSVKDIKDANRRDVHMTRDDVIAQGYQPCGKCKP